MILKKTCFIHHLANNSNNTLNNQEFSVILEGLNTYSKHNLFALWNEWPNQREKPELCFSVLYICSNKIFPFVISKKYSQLKQKLSLSYA